MIVRFTRRPATQHKWRPYFCWMPLVFEDYHEKHICWLSVLERRKFGRRPEWVYRIPRTSTSSIGAGT